MLVFGGGVFGRWLVGALMNVISVFMKKNSEDSPAPSTMWGHSHTEQQMPWSWTFQPSRTWKKYFFVCLSRLLYDIFVIASQREKDNCISKKKKKQTGNYSSSLCYNNLSYVQCHRGSTTKRRDIYQLWKPEFLDHYHPPGKLPGVCS